MGVYVFSVEEIKDELWKALDEIQGEVFKKDFKKAAKEVYDEYRHFS